jgi:UDP-N-acetylglucosamine 2-epimerase (non-hydrolysing)/GDP/UDP-N,N'-diacetylbacillosamine 2-epimerase (hydrolysing)
MRIPLAHVAGGECDVASNIDFQLRNAITQMALLHFAGCRLYADRIAAMAQEAFRIHIVGTPSLDGIAEDLVAPAELGPKLGVDFSRPTVVATVLPVTLRPEEHAAVMEALLLAISRMPGLQVIFTGVNADAGGRWIAHCVEKVSTEQSRIRAFASLGARRYHSVLAAATAVAGNSSSGVIETPSFGVPTVNIGTRQDGRLRAGNVIDVPPDADAVEAALNKALHDADFRRRCHAVKNPLGDGRAGARIADVLATVEMNERLLVKALPGAR